MSSDSMQDAHTQIVVAGGGPAGMMLGYLLARAGIETIVLEKHADFLRDFRGDTVHPSTLQIMHELGLLEEFLTRPHQKTYRLQGYIGDEHVTVADFTHLRKPGNFIAFMPQWDFLDFLADKAKTHPHFHLLMQTKATGLLQENGKIAGIHAETEQGPVKIRAGLTVAADGRHSILRDFANLPLQTLGAPIDVFWMRLSRNQNDPDTSLGRIVPGKLLALINRGDYWQCAYVIRKGAAAEIQRQGIEAFRAEIVEAVPFFADRIMELKSFDDVKLLTVAVDRLTRWYDEGFLCIGDAAHAMSPVGGVGINLAVQDAVAAANILVPAIRDGQVTIADLKKIQQRRMLAVRVIQAAQVFFHKRIIEGVISSRTKFRTAWPVKALKLFPWLARIPAFIIGLGIRPEHIRH